MQVTDQSPGTVVVDDHNLANLIDVFETYGSRPALTHRGLTLSYSDLSHRARQWAAAIHSRGVQPGDRVALLHATNPEWAAAFFGILASGGVVVPLANEADLAELTGQLTIVDVSLIVASKEEQARARRLSQRFCHGRLLVDAGTAEQPMVKRSGDTAAVIGFTSGTSGAPKGVVITHDNLRFQLDAFNTVFPEVPPRTVSFLPWHHIFGLTADLLACLARGTHIAVCSTRVPAQIADVITSHQPTCMIVVPAFLAALRRGIERNAAATPGGRGLLSISARLPRWLRRVTLRSIHRRIGGELDFFISGGAPLDNGTARFFQGLGIDVCQGYGMTETSPVVSFERRDDATGMTVGRPLPGVEVVVTTQGELLTRGPHVMSGYYGDSSATRAAIDAGGWLHTGDLGRFDAEGRLVINGRIKNLIVLACGKKVAGEEVEAALCGAALIDDCAVLGMPRSNGGEEVVVAVLPGNDLRHLDQRAKRCVLTQAIARETEGLAAFKRPTRVIVLTAPLPRTLSGKIRRAELKRIVTEEITI